VVLHRQNGHGPSAAPGAISASVEQVAYLGGNVQYLVRSNGGLSITVLAPKTGERLPVGGAVDVTWAPADALVLADPPAGHEEATR
jgi:ABC-type Fe3+/spermidine/putrescine transport system ATPase subunit